MSAERSRCGFAEAPAGRRPAAAEDHYDRNRERSQQHRRHSERAVVNAATGSGTSSRGSIASVTATAAATATTARSELVEREAALREVLRDVF